MKFKSLGKRVNVYGGRLETFKKPTFASWVVVESDEVTAMCPVTGQPDWYRIIVTYTPDKLCVESKSMKLFLQSFRHKGLFCEAFADAILKEIVMWVYPKEVTVEVIQKPRGGVTIHARSEVHARAK